MSEPRQRPVAHLALRDPARRSDIARALRERGWTVVEASSGYHLVDSIAGALLGDQPWPRLDAIAADAVSPGGGGLWSSSGRDGERVGLHGLEPTPALGRRVVRLQSGPVALTARRARRPGAILAHDSQTSACRAHR